MGLATPPESKLCFVKTIGMTKERWKCVVSQTANILQTCPLLIPHATLGLDILHIQMYFYHVGLLSTWHTAS